ncbi:hypothetical protein [Halothiobacillus sp.]|jgi:hypothetical protein|uniref:hypothetical protein n=1 Tax=Halothiobacillus sp. TaxID=1891311 RepID=UPI00260A323E|nr:hypothetical protein [Halothiobacillus sp.]
MQITQITQIGECQFNYTIEDFRRYQARPFSSQNGLMWPQEIAEHCWQSEVRETSGESAKPSLERAGRD